MRSRFILLAVVAVAFVPDSLAAQDNSAKPVAVPRVFRGAGDCLKCHTGGVPKGPDPLLAAAGFGENLTDDSWVLLDEVKTWITLDRHLQAFTALKNKRSERMGDLLGVKEIHRDKRCLACHTGFPLVAMGDDPHLMPAELVTDLKVAQGVSCEGCHSPSGDAVSGDAKGWYLPHANKEAWRFLSGGDKSSKFGFTNIRSSVTRSRLCLSCHLGNAGEGKIVTHEMYAAGHPPLPGFELQTFAQQMPKHWRDFDKKSDAVRDEFLRRNADDVYGRESFKLDNLHETQAALVAALVSYSENLKLAGALADTNLKTPVIKPDWPELSQFECFACHHDLKDKSWRQRRIVRGTPGRPQLRSWPTVLAKLAIKTLGQEPQELDRQTLSVEKLLSDQPFGQQDRWGDAIKPATEWLDQQAVALERQPISREAGVKLLRNIVAMAENEYWDYDSARQIVWLTQVLRRELASDRSPPTIREMVAGIDAELTDVEKLFALNLLDGQKAQQEVPGSTKTREVVEVDLTKSLPPIADYDAVLFREKVVAIGKKLAK